MASDVRAQQRDEQRRCLVSTLAISSTDYHDEIGLADQPCLSKSTCHTLITSSPAHAKAAHPKLSPRFARTEEDKFDVGNAAHQLVLEGDAGVWVVNEDSWRSGNAKEAKAYARSMGKIPLLSKYWDAVQEMAEAIWEQLPFFDTPGLFTAGKPEQTIVWVENGVTWKARLDWLKDDLSACHDLKTTGRSASPEAWSKSMVGIGADLQHVIYRRGMKAVYGVDIPLTFVVVETSAPYAMCTFELSPAAIALAEQKVDFAAETWKRCLAADSWPAYPTKVVHVEPAAWAENQWFERTYRDEVAA